MFFRAQYKNSIRTHILIIIYGMLMRCFGKKWRRKRPPTSPTTTASDIWSNYTLHASNQNFIDAGTRLQAYIFSHKYRYHLVFTFASTLSLWQQKTNKKYSGLRAYDMHLKRLWFSDLKMTKLSQFSLLVNF